MIHVTRPPRLMGAFRRPRSLRLPRLRYLALPAAALAVVVAVQLVPSSGTGSAGTSTSVDPARQVLAPGDVGLPGGGAVGGVNTTSVDSKIAFWRARIQEQGDAASSYQVLGDLLSLRGRSTGDLDDYTAAQQAYDTAVRLAPRDVSSIVGLARILATLHEFPQAIDQALAGLAIDQTATGAVAVLFDASVEIGRLDDADDALSVLQQRDATDSAIQIRKARLEFLRGDAAQAIAVASAARDAAVADHEDPASIAFYDYAVGEYRFMTGDIAGAGTDYGASAKALPGYVPALFGEARVAYARSDLSSAIALLRQAVAIVPRPDIVAYLGDLLARTGDPAGADQQFQTVDFIAALGTTGGQVYNREYALFLASHGRDTANAVTLTANELVNRKDVYGYDAYAWALLNDGQAAAALSPASSALALGTPDGRLLGHAGLVELANGLTTQGQANLQRAQQLGLAYDPVLQRRVDEAVGK